MTKNDCRALKFFSNRYGINSNGMKADLRALIATIWGSPSDRPANNSIVASPSKRV